MRQITRLCKRCGEPFQQRGKEAYLCEACAMIAKRESVLQDRTCQQCGKTFLGGPRAWYCPDCRVERKREQIAAHRKAGTARPLGTIDLCVRCGKPYVVNGSRQKYCPDCSVEAVKEVVRPHKRAYNQSLKDELYPYKAIMRKRWGVCVICGCTVIDRGGKATCSDECERKHRAQNQAIADVKRGRRKSAAPRVRTAPQSGIPGITWSAKRGKWQVNYRKKYYGLYADIEAAKAALEAAKAADPPAP